jgi:hypothetical protein
VFDLVTSRSIWRADAALPATLHELRERNPDIFGPGGGGSRMFSLTEMSFCTGLLLGPLVCGPLADAFGFYYTACALGKRLSIVGDGFGY